MVIGHLFPSLPFLLTTRRNGSARGPHVANARYLLCEWREREHLFASIDLSSTTPSLIDGRSESVYVRRITVFWRPTKRDSSGKRVYEENHCFLTTNQKRDGGCMPLREKNWKWIL
jgi:hypothetical protein